MAAQESICVDRGLLTKIALYTDCAKSLEGERAQIRTALQKKVLEEIVPRVEAQLPAGYGIDRNKSAITCAYPLGNDASPNSNAVPIGFNLHLRLLYGGQPLPPLFGVGEERGEVERVEKLLRPELNKISEEYGLVHAGVYGEPEPK